MYYGFNVSESWLSRIPGSINGEWQHFESSVNNIKISQSPVSIEFDSWNRVWVSSFQENTDVIADVVCCIEVTCAITFHDMLCSFGASASGW